MADMMEYKCPACGGAMEFDSKSQKMKCPYCDSEMSIEEFQSMQQTDVTNKKSLIWQEDSGRREKRQVCGYIPVSPAAERSLRRKVQVLRPVPSAETVWL